MFSLKKQKLSASSKSRGFTIVELLIVIIVIAILATLVIMTFNNAQKNARDAQRRTDIAAIQTLATSYFTEKGYFPTLDDLTSGGWRGTNARGFDPAALVDPKGGTIAGAAATATTYGYVVTSSTGGGCDTTLPSSETNACDTFVLTAVLEKDGTTYTKNSN